MKISTDENIDIPDHHIYLNDKLNRQPEVDNLVEIISKLSQPCTIAIDGSWGTGKTTFLRFLQAELQKKNIKVSYFNAWEKDFDKEPFLLILNHIVKQFSVEESNVKDIKKIAVKVLRSITVNSTKAIINSVLPIKIDGILEDASSILAEEIFDKLTEEEEEVKALQKKLSQLIDKNNKMVILVDELDRCKPSFSIELLERIKHIFNTPNIIFILGADLAQLGKAVSGVYGESYDGRKYLDRFISIEYNLAFPNYENFWQSLAETYTGHSSIQSLQNQAPILEYGPWYSKQLQLSARDIKKLYSSIYLSALSSNSEDELPLIILLTVIKQNSQELYNRMKQNLNYVDELFQLLQLQNFVFKNLKNEIILQVFLLIHNIILANDSSMKSPEVIELITQKTNSEDLKTFIKTFIEQHKTKGVFLIKDLESTYKMVDLQVKISHKQFVTVSSSTSVKFGNTRTLHSN